METVRGDELEQQLHDLRLDFAVTSRESLSRPLQLTRLASCRFRLLVPRRLFAEGRAAVLAFRQKRLPLALAGADLPPVCWEVFRDHKAALWCQNILEVQAAMQRETLAGLLPDFASQGFSQELFFALEIRELRRCCTAYSLAWNPRLLRLNPPAASMRDWLAKRLAQVMAAL